MPQSSKEGVGTTPSPAEDGLDDGPLSEEARRAMESMKKGEVYWSPRAAQAFAQSRPVDPVEDLRGTSDLARERGWNTDR